MVLELNVIVSANIDAFSTIFDALVSDGHQVRFTSLEKSS